MMKTNTLFEQSRITVIEIGSKLLLILNILLIWFTFSACQKQTPFKKEVVKELDRKDTPIIIKSSEDAKKYAPGTWQFTNPCPMWEKYVIKGDNTYECYHAQPRDGKWTFINTGRWQIRSDRYTDTGEEYLFIEVFMKETNKSSSKSEYSYRFVFENSNELYSKNLGAIGNSKGIRTEESPWK
ncbi:MAG: hypothetical protein NTV87_16330 [Ignavibacteriae bacterium]|nr:hypothetical protein [Ignavibacteriota bacterium]